MECYSVLIPDSVKVPGSTAAGQPSAVLPGEYLVHRIRPKGVSANAPAMLRFVGADPIGRDVHVAADSLRRLLAESGVIVEARRQAEELAQAH